MLLYGGSLVDLKGQFRRRVLIQLLLLRRDNRGSLQPSQLLFLLHVEIQPMQVGRLTRVDAELAHQIVVHQVVLGLANLLDVPCRARHEALPMVVQARRVLRDVHTHIVCLDLPQIVRLLVLGREVLGVVYRLGVLGRILLL